MKIISSQRRKERLKVEGKMKQIAFFFFFLGQFRTLVDSLFMLGFW